MKQLLIPSMLVAAGLALGACGSDAKDKVSSAVSEVQAAATAASDAACSALTSAADTLKPYETVSADQVSELKDKVLPAAQKLDSALSTLGSKLSGDIGTKVTDATKQLEDALANADTDPQAAADKASAAVKSLNEQITAAESKLSCS